MQTENGDTPPEWGHGADDASDIRDWIAVLEETLRVSKSETQSTDTDLTEDLEQALKTLRASLGAKDNSNSA